MHNRKVQFSIESLEPKTFKNLINQGSVFLQSKNITNSKNEIEWFLQDLYQFNKANLYKHSNTLISPQYYNIINKFIYHRSKGRPFQYLLKKASFYGRDFIVNSNVLIPRPETEVLIDIIKNEKYEKLLDIGTGSGAIAITANLENIAQAIDAIDIDIKILRIAKENQVRLKASKVNFFKLNILKNIPKSKYDIIVSNPPYVSFKEYQKLDVNIQKHEPIKAVTDFNDPAYFLRRDYSF